jgi:Glyoxalase-like domain
LAHRRRRSFEEVLMAIRVQVVFDCADPRRLAEFWALALEYTLQPPPEGFASWEEFLTSIGVPESEMNSRNAVVDPDGAGPRLFFQRVPERKTIKNRVHLDLYAGGGGAMSARERAERVDAKVRQLTAAGASIFKVMEERGERWVVMRDPEGNELCVQ